MTCRQTDAQGKGYGQHSIPLQLPACHVCWHRMSDVEHFTTERNQTYNQRVAFYLSQIALASVSGNNLVQHCKLPARVQ